MLGMNAQAFQTAAELIAFHGKPAALRIATAQVKKAANTITPKTVATMTFWGEVLQRCAGLELSHAEMTLLRSSCSKVRCAALMALLPTPVALLAQYHRWSPHRHRCRVEARGLSHRYESGATPR